MLVLAAHGIGSSRLSHPEAWSVFSAPNESVSAEFIGPCFRQSLVRYFTRGVQKFGNFWKMTSGVQLGSTVDTHSRVSLRSLRQSLVRRLPPGVQEILVVWRDEFDAHAWSLKWINAHASVYGGVISQVFFHVKVDLGSRGRSRVLFTPGQSGHCFHGPVYLAVMRQTTVAAGRVPAFST